MRWTKRRPKWHQTRPAAEFDGGGMGPPHFYVVRCKGTFQEFRYQVATFYGTGKAIFMAASAHSGLHPAEDVSEVIVEDQGPVPESDGFLGDEWMIDRYEY